MNPVEILHMVETGLTVAQMVVEAGRDAAPIIQNLIQLAKGGVAGTVTPEQIAEHRALLDAEMAEFNKDLPDDGTS